MSLDRLDERLDRQLVEQGRMLTVYLEARLSESTDFSSDSDLAFDIALYLEQASEESKLHRIFLFDTSQRVLFDSRNEVEVGQREPLLQADREQLQQLWRDEPSTTPFYPVENGYAKRAYLPLSGSSGNPDLGLALEAGAVSFEELGRFKRALSTLSLISLLVGGGALLVLMQVMRRQRRIEEILSRTERAMEAGQLTAALAHELRNPLGIMHTNAEVLLDRVQDRDKEIVRDILGEVRRLSSLIGRFLNLSSQKPSSWTSCSVREVLEKVTERQKGKWAPQGVDISLHLSQDNDPIRTQVDRLESVFDNLIENAAHAVEGSQEGHVEITVKSRRKWIEVIIEDNGPGFSPEALRMALHPFYSERPKGTGIGLTLARRIVEDHGGKLMLSNRRGGGAQVKLLFPRQR